MSQTDASYFATLRQFVGRSFRGGACELCAQPLQGQHQHLIELATRRLLCACEACALLFDAPSKHKYRRVPRRIQFFREFQITDARWENLHLPINLAFFYFNSVASRMVAVYPSPAGPVESQLTLETWDELMQANLVLKGLEPDVEALLVNRIGHNHQYCRLPIDECYKLVGLIRIHWRGLSGGTEVWREFNRFFKELEDKAAPTGATHA
jgi:hypothetical protein